MEPQNVTNLWDERYSQERLSFGDKPNDFLRSQEQLILAGGKRALCLGEGEGRNAIWLAQLGLDVTAVDLSSVGLRKAAEWVSRLGLTIKTVHADLNTWQFEPGGWDLIVSIFCHLPADVRANVHGKVLTGLAVNGLFIAEAYTPSQVKRGTGGPPDPRLMATAEQLAHELEGLHFIEIQELSRDVTEGHRHTGLADVVQVVAQNRTKDRLGLPPLLEHC